LGIGNIGKRKDDSTPDDGFDAQGDPILKIGNGALGHDPDRGWGVLHTTQGMPPHRPHPLSRLAFIDH
jgi:hypothetical protein